MKVDRGEIIIRGCFLQSTGPTFQTFPRQEQNKLWIPYKEESHRNPKPKMKALIMEAQRMLCSVCMSFREMSSHQSSNNPSTTNENHQVYNKMHNRAQTHSQI